MYYRLICYLYIDTERKAAKFVISLIFNTVDIFKHTAKKIRELNEQIKFYLKCMLPPQGVGLVGLESV
jgi:hypothetical protein